MNNEIPDFFKEKDIFGLEKPIVKMDMNPPEQNPEPDESDIVYATLGTRFGAYLLDAAILLIPLILLDGVVFGPEFANPENSLKINLLNFVAWTVYYGVMESSEGQATIGKRLCGIKVIDTLGNRLTFSRAALRYVAQFISILPLGFGIWAIATDEKKQGWHDSLMDCYVIKSKAKEPNSE